MSGILSCTTYAFMPNRLAYCGPSADRTLFDYGITHTVDQGLKDILVNFKNLWPYLRFIANSNLIEDAFDEKVVEAYWIGNDLLEKTSKKDLFRHLTESLNLKKRISPRSLEYLLGKIPLGAKPHHTFHVFNVFVHTGHPTLAHTLETMDNCRVSWGQIQEIQKDSLIVKSRVLEMAEGRLRLSSPRLKTVQRSFDEKTFIQEPKIKDWVSFHWNFACEILTPKQVKNLSRYTGEAIKLANLTI
ncbi:MAG: DUF6390 family protein [Patescibacteria group bacterium]|nr:DUF6390 family protein [Patescibacteria group bacterium]